MKILTRLIAAFIVGFGLDGISKIWAEQSLVIYEPVPIIGNFFRFTLGYNTGIAFGLFANGGVWPLIVTGIVIAALSLWFVKGVRKSQFPPAAGWAIGLLLGGAIGNFVDRVPDGRVTDFLDVGIGQSRWPTFNLADSFILIGLFFLMLIEMMTPSQDQTEEAT